MVDRPAAKEPPAERSPFLTISHIAREVMPELYYPGADWRSADSYPALKPDKEYKRPDYLRLAWEILRRVPRYRWHAKRIIENEFLNEDSFRDQGYFIDSSSLFPRRGTWKDLPIGNHVCSPDSEPNEVLGAYIERNAGSPWRVFHCHGWAKRLWGVASLMAPTAEATDEMLANFFAPSAPQMISSDASDEFYVKNLKERSKQSAAEKYGINLRNDDLPVEYSTMLSAREILVRLRVDLPISSQIETVRKLMLRAQRKARLEKVNKSARLTDLGISSFWLRTWDAAQEAKRENLQLPRKALISHLSASASAVSREVKDYPVRSKTKGVSTFGDAMASALDVERVEKWVNKSSAYIENQDDFYRVLVAKAFSV